MQKRVYKVVLLYKILKDFNYAERIDFPKIDNKF